MCSQGLFDYIYSSWAFSSGLAYKIIVSRSKSICRHHLNYCVAGLDERFFLLVESNHVLKNWVPPQQWIHCLIISSAEDDAKMWLISRCDAISEGLQTGYINRPSEVSSCNWTHLRIIFSTVTNLNFFGLSPPTWGTAVTSLLCNMKSRLYFFSERGRKEAMAGEGRKTMAGGKEGGRR